MALTTDQITLARIIERMARIGPDSDVRAFRVLARNFMVSMRDNSPEDRAQFLIDCGMRAELEATLTHRVDDELAIKAERRAAALRDPKTSAELRGVIERINARAHSRKMGEEMTQTAARIQTYADSRLAPHLDSEPLSDAQRKARIAQVRMLELRQFGLLPTPDHAMPSPRPALRPETIIAESRARTYDIAKEWLDWYEADRERGQKPSES